MIIKIAKITGLLCFCFAGVQAQETVTTTGGEATGSGGTVSYTVGQVSYSAVSGPEHSVTEGVQQSVEIITAGSREIKESIALSVFPNPTAGNLTLDIENFSNSTFSYQLLDTHGRLLKSGDITASQTQLKISDLPSGSYFLHVVQENKMAQSFKFIKK